VKRGQEKTRPEDPVGWLVSESVGVPKYQQVLRPYPLREYEQLDELELEVMWVTALIYGGFGFLSKSFFRFF